MKRIWIATVAIALCCVMLLPFLGTTTEAATSSGGKFTNEVSRTTKEITLSNGTKTGVMWTQAKINGEYYGKKDLVVNIAEFDLANTHLSVEVLNHGTYLVNRTTSIVTEINKYNNANPGQTVLAAVNGDLFMTSSHSNSNVTTRTLAVSRGIMIIDGEIWATQQTTQENIKATGFDAGKPVDEKNAFGVTNTNQPIVGAPMFTVTMTGNGKTIKTDGLNRLPAIDSITVYNHRVNSSNYALNDSYEIEMEVVGSPAFSLNSTVTAKVKAIYPAGSTSRPSIGSNTILITARGSRISEVQDKFPIGTQVTFTTTVTDSWNNASLWKTVEDAIGGYIAVVKDNLPFTWNTTTSGYPSTFIGIKDDGTVGFVTVTSAKDHDYSSLNRNQAYAFCMEYGYNRVFHLDGGGSTIMCTLENGSYVRRTTGSDEGGVERTVINSVAVVWNDTPVCEKQGYLNHIKGDLDLSNTSPTYLDRETLSAVYGTNNQLISFGYNRGPSGTSGFNCEWLYNPSAASDPYIYVNYSLLERTNAQNYRYVVIKYLSTMEAHNVSIYYNCGSNTVASSSRVKTVQAPAYDDNWHYLVFDMQGASGWTGQLNNIRIDFYDGKTTPAMGSFLIQSVSLCKDESEVNDVKNGGEPGVCYHTYSTKTTKYATCTETGEKTSTCTKCGEVTTSTLKALGHRYTTTTVAATCTEPAKTVKACNRPGCTHTEETTSGTALGHDHKTTTTAATCTTDGKKVTTCSRCDFKETEVLTASGHSYKTTTTAATCTTDGKTVTTCKNCDYSKTETIKASGHDTKTTTTAATCTKDGKKVTTCKNCDYSKTETIKASGHSYKTTTTAATCTKDGKKVTTCKNCDYSKTETLTATGHTYQNGTCSSCGEAAPVTTEAVTTAPDTTVPDTTVPDTTAPDTTVPDTTAPDTTAPDTTVPDTTALDTTVPNTTVPDTTIAETELPTTTEANTTEAETAEADTTAADTEAPVTEGESGSSVKTVAIVLMAIGGAVAVVAAVLLLVGKKKKD